MRSRSSFIQVITHGAWRFEIFDDRAAGWRLVLHPPAGPHMTMACKEAGGLNGLLAEARALAVGERFQDRREGAPRGHDPAEGGARIAG